MSDRPKTSMTERRRRRSAGVVAKAERSEQSQSWMRERLAALHDAKAKAKRKRARVRKSASGTGRVPAHLRKIPTPASLATFQEAPTDPRGPRAQRRANGQRATHRISLAGAVRPTPDTLKRWDREARSPAAR